MTQLEMGQLQTFCHFGFLCVTMAAPSISMNELLSTQQIKPWFKEETKDNSYNILFS